MNNTLFQFFLLPITSASAILFSSPVISLEILDKVYNFSNPLVGVAHAQTNTLTNDEKLLIQQAQEKILQRRLNEVLEIATQILKVNPKSAQAYYYRGWAQFQVKRSAKIPIPAASRRGITEFSLRDALPLKSFLRGKPRGIYPY